MRNNHLFSCLALVLIFSMGCKAPPAENPDPRPKENYLEYKGTRYAMDKFFVYTDTMPGFYKTGLYLSEFVLVSPGLGARYDSSDITKMSGKGDEIFLEIVSSRFPPMDGKYDFMENPDVAGKFYNLFFLRGFDVAQSKIKEVVEPKAGMVHFAVKDAARRRYSISISTSELNGTFEADFVMFKRF